MQRFAIAMLAQFQHELQLHTNPKVQEIDEKGLTNARKPAVEWESPFVAELRHFHDCIANGTTCRTPVKDALDDIALIINITESYLKGGPVEVAR